MVELSFKEFLKLTDKDKCERYNDLSNHDKLLARMNQNPSVISSGEKVDISKADNTWLVEEDKKWKEEKKLHEH